MGESTEAIAASCFLGCFFFSYAVLISLLRRALMRGWRSVSCSIRERGQHWVYEYEFEGRRYEGRRVSVLDALPIDFATREERLRARVSDGIAQAHISANTPTASCLDRRFDVGSVVVYGVSACAFFLAGLFAVRNVQGRAALIAFSAMVAAVAAVSEAIRYYSLRSRPQDGD